MYIEAILKLNERTNSTLSLQEFSFKMTSNLEIRTDCRKLLKHLTSKDISEDCINAVIRQLRQDCDYTTEQDVKKSIDGMQHKFLIHAEYEKSQNFIQLVTKFIQLTSPSGLTHSTWSILYLLIRLAFRPTQKLDYHKGVQILKNLPSVNSVKNLGGNKCGALQHSKSEETEVLQTCLPETPDSWTDDDENDGELSCDETPYCIQPVTSTAVEKPLPVHHLVKKQEFSETSLNDLIRKKYQDPGFANCQHKNWTEFQLLHEFLWNLQTYDNMSVLQSTAASSGIELKAIPLTSLITLSDEPLHSLIQGLRLINSFINSMVPHEAHSLTYQAYTSALSDIVTKFYRSLSQFEQNVAEQKMTVTVTHMFIFLKPWQQIFASLAEMHECIMQPYKASNNNSRVTRLMSVLFDSSLEAQVTSYLTLYPILLQLLFASLQPFLNMVNIWLNKGQLLDPHKEFGIIRNDRISPQDERFWFDSLLIHSSHPFVNILLPLMDDILLGGRSVELLTQLNRFLNITSLSVVTDCCPKSLNDTFRERFNNRFKCADDHPNASSFVSSMLRVSSCPEENKNKNILLSKAFKSLRDVVRVNSDEQEVRQEVQPNGLKTPPEFYPLSPLLEKSLMEPIRNRQRLVCRALIDTMFKHCGLREHILTLRRIHFMHAGDVMGRFCLQLFQKLNTGEKWDESSLTLSLLNCLSPRMSRYAPYISVNIGKGSYQPIGNLTNIHINYAVPWPINLVLTQESLIMYNSILGFLLKLKYAMVSLQRLSFKELNSMDKKASSCSRQNEVLSTVARRHRLQLLRAWLLHFVSSVDNYIMECVLESSHNKLDFQIEKAVNLGEIIDSHKEYVCSVHKQCLQQPSGAFLRDAINEVLTISTDVAFAWIKGIEAERLSELEENYVRRHQYVAAVLATDAAHSMLPHVETLAAALIYSCPATRQS